MNEETFKDKKWNEFPFSFPPVNTLAMVEYDTAQQEWYRWFVLALGDDADGEFCQFQWLEGPKTNQTTYYYTPESFRPLLPVKNKQEKSVDNLLKELHNLKQEQKAICNKIDNILNEINDVMKENGLAIVFTEKFNQHEYRA